MEAVSALKPLAAAAAAAAAPQPLLNIDRKSLAVGGGC